MYDVKGAGAAPGMATHEDPGVKQVFLDRKLLVLVSLLTGPKHGYALMKDIEASFAVRLGPGTLYACVGSLEKEGLVEAMPSVDRRHPYRITPRGDLEVRRAIAEVARVTSVALTRVSAT